MIYIIITTCVFYKFGVKDDKHRKNRYIDCITSLLNLLDKDPRIKPIIVEGNKHIHNSETYLDNLNCEILYTDNNKYDNKNKGIIELMDIKSVIEHYNIKDTDTIIKVTGRYMVKTIEFINLVIDKCDTIDAFVKFYNVCTLKYHTERDDCVLGLYAIKCKYLKEFNYNNKSKMGRRNSPEKQFAKYVRDNVQNTLEIKDLCIECCFADDLRKLNV